MKTPDLDALPAIPRDDEGPVFRAPWEAQAFAMAVVLHERGHFTWKEWAGRLADEIAAARERGESDDGKRYYHFWLTTLEKLVADKRIVLADELNTRRDAWEEAARNTPPLVTAPPNPNSPAFSRKNSRFSGKNKLNRVRLTRCSSASTWAKSVLTVRSVVRFCVKPYFTSMPASGSTSLFTAGRLRWSVVTLDIT